MMMPLVEREACVEARQLLALPCLESDLRVDLPVPGLAEPKSQGTHSGHWNSQSSLHSGCRALMDHQDAEWAARAAERLDAGLSWMAGASREPAPRQRQSD